MKKLIVLASLLPAVLFSFAQSTAEGYYVKQDNDTVRAQIRIRKGVFGQGNNNFLQEVEVIESGDSSKLFLPTDIKGYGVIYKGSLHVFVSKPVKDGSLKFLTPVYMGKLSSLYQHGSYQSGSGTALPEQKTFYTFEKADGSYLFLRDILNKKFRAELAEFYKDNPEVLQIINTKLKYWLELKKDLKELMIAANKTAGSE